MRGFRVHRSGTISYSMKLKCYCEKSQERVRRTVLFKLRIPPGFFGSFLYSFVSFPLVPKLQCFLSFKYT